MKIEVKKVKKRNPLHDHPLLRKGGVHRKTNKAVRKHDKQSIKKEWSDLILFNQVVFS